MATITDVFEGPRGCGFRKPGGLYLRCDGQNGRNCGRMPLALTVCPCCGGGIKPSLGWTWVDGDQLFDGVECKTQHECCDCPVSTGLGRAGMIWIGECFYPTPADFMAEARTRGISRRIHSIPRQFEVGKTWVLLAHRKAVPGHDETGQEIFSPGIFLVWKPDRIEYVVTDQETEEDLERMEQRGITLVRVHRTGDTAPLPIEIDASAN